MTQPMDASCSLVVSFCSFRYDGNPTNGTYATYGGYPHPRDIQDPDGVVRSKWVGQTIMDSIWKLYQFDTTEARDNFAKNAPEIYEEAEIKTFDQEFYDHWTKDGDGSIW